MTPQERTVKQASNARPCVKAAPYYSTEKDIDADKAAQSPSPLSVKDTEAAPSGRPASSASTAAQILIKAGSEQIDRVDPGTESAGLSLSRRQIRNISLEHDDKVSGEEGWGWVAALDRLGWSVSRAGGEIVNQQHRGSTPHSLRRLRPAVGDRGCSWLADLCSPPE